MTGDPESHDASGPGARLRSERERLGLSLDEVAESLRLDARIVRALESDDYTTLPAPIFVKGYLNAYCKLLGLSAREILTEYERVTGTGRPPPLHVSRGTGEQVTSSHARVAIVSWIVALAAVAMVVLWWMSREVVESVPEAVTETEQPVEAETLEPAPAEEEVPREPAPRTLVDMFAEVEAPDEAVVADEPPPGWLVVELRYDEDCWTEVTDVAGRRLHFDLVREGGSLTLEGQGPFSVFLGNAPAVTVTVDGEPFDHSRFIRADNVARFTIEPEESP